MANLDEPEFQQSMERIETLLAELKQHADPKVRAGVQQMVQGLLDLHGVALERILERVAEVGRDGLAAIDALADDDLVGNVFLLYGLHPVDLESRVLDGLDDARRALGSLGGDVEFLRLAGGVVHVRLTSDGSPSSAQALKSAVEDAIYNKAPDVASVEFSGLGALFSQCESNGHARFALPLV
jgi:Fe-S cluster biogenesis protein NfuA